MAGQASVPSPSSPSSPSCMAASIVLPEGLVEDEPSLVEGRAVGCQSASPKAKGASVGEGSGGKGM